MHFETLPVASCSPLDGVCIAFAAGTPFYTRAASLLIVGFIVFRHVHRTSIFRHREATDLIHQESLYGGWVDEWTVGVLFLSIRSIIEGTWCYRAVDAT